MAEVIVLLLDERVDVEDELCEVVVDNELCVVVEDEEICELDVEDDVGVLDEKEELWEDDLLELDVEDDVGVLDEEEEPWEDDSLEDELVDKTAILAGAVVAAAESLYMFSRSPAPQYSVLSPGQRKLQSAWLATLILPAAMLDEQ